MCWRKSRGKIETLIWMWRSVSCFWVVGMLLDGSYNHWKDIDEYKIKYKGKVHTIRWDV